MRNAKYPVTVQDGPKFSVPYSTLSKPVSVYYFADNKSYASSKNSSIVNHSEPSNDQSDSENGDWSSLDIPIQPKLKSVKSSLYEAGLYDPGSGEICTKYIPHSDSTVIRHVYYNYPSLKDPGIVEALLEPEPLSEVGGIQYYMDLCQELKTVPIGIFKRNIDKKVIDLKYYGVTSKGVQAICLTLRFNQAVRRLDLSGNFLDQHACFHLGQLLEENEYLKEVVLSNCKLYVEGFRRVIRSVWRRHCLDTLCVSGNHIGDEGFLDLIDQFDRGAFFKKIDVSRNNLTDQSALELAKVVQTRDNIFNHLDISWNSIGIDNSNANQLLRALALSSVLVEVNLSFNHLSSTSALKPLIMAPKLLVLDLRNNQIGSKAVRFIEKGIIDSIKLRTLKLSRNPLTPQDALRILIAFGSATTTVQHLRLNNVDVEREFVEESMRIKSQRAYVTITHGRVINDYVLKGVPLGEVVLKRINFLCRSKKETKKQIDFDFCQYLLTLKDEGKELVEPKMFLRELKNRSIKKIDEDLIEELCNAFLKVVEKVRYVDLFAACDYIKRLYPEKKPEKPQVNVFEPLKIKTKVKNRKKDKKTLKTKKRAVKT